MVGLAPGGRRVTMGLGRERARRLARLAGEGAGRLPGVVLQLGLVALGVAFISTEDHEEAVGMLLGWCMLGSVYWLAVVAALSAAVRRPVEKTGPITSGLAMRRLSTVVSTPVTLLSSAVGLGAAAELIVMRGDPRWSGVIELVAVWAMILSWGLFHWGYAQIYYRLYFRSAGEPPLRFPGAEGRPRLTDFVYFAFANGTSFAVSDVEVVDARLRWTVMWHTAFSFFLNALIIVLAVNTVTSADGIAG